MIRYRRANLANRSFHKFVLRDQKSARPWDDTTLIKIKVAKAKAFCSESFPDDQWTCFEGPDYGLFLIADDEDATIFHLKFLEADREYKGRKLYS